jgi:hypothetical protein
MVKEDRAIASFSTPTGYYEYLRMPFGMKSTFSIF